MKNIRLYVPKPEDLWFRQECLNDPKTMNYNAGYDVGYEGYHYETGCIDFPKEKWRDWYEDKFRGDDFFYAYILDEETKNFVGHVNFRRQENGKATMGIVVKDEFRGQGYMRPALNLLLDKAKQSGILCLTDSVPKNREKALKVFYDMGFKKVGEHSVKKFNQDEIVAEIEKRFD